MLNQKNKIIITFMTISIFMTSSIDVFALINKNQVSTSQSIVYKKNTTQEILQNKNNEKYKWNLADIYANVQEWEKDIEKLKKDYFPKFKEYEGKLKDSKKLLEYFKFDEETTNIYKKVYYYARLNSDLNLKNSTATELKSKASSIIDEYVAASSFFEPELLSQDESSLKKLASDSALKDYSHYIDSLIKQKQHILSKNEENILAYASAFSSCPNEIFMKLKMADMPNATIKNKDGRDIELTRSTYMKISTESDRELRRIAAEAVGKIREDFQNTFASTLLASINKDIFLAKSRKYNSTLEAALISNDIPKEVYDNLVKSVNNNLGPLHKYIELRRKLLNIDKVHSYDFAVPLVADYDFKIPYEDAKTMILDGLKPLGTEYLSILKQGFDNRWVDVYESDGKVTTSYNLGLNGVHPFVLLNYNDNLASVIEAAHELGHAVNSVYAQKAQPYVSETTPIFNSEVASTANELIMMKYLITNSKNDDEKLYLLDKLIENISGTIYTQVMFAEFEKTVHEKVENGEPLSAKSLRNLYGDLITKYNGSSFALDDYDTTVWSNIPHFYNTFYVYKYATSMAASNQIVANILDGKDKNAVNNYLNFLKIGSSEYPIDALKKAGVDATKTTSIDTILTEFGQYVDQMESILIKQGKIK